MHRAGHKPAAFAADPVRAAAKLGLKAAPLAADSAPNHQVVPTGRPQHLNTAAQGHHLGPGDPRDVFRTLPKELRHGHEPASHEPGGGVNPLLDDRVPVQVAMGGCGRPARASASRFASQPCPGHPLANAAALSRWALILTMVTFARPPSA